MRVEEARRLVEGLLRGRAEEVRAARLLLDAFTAENLEYAVRRRVDPVRILFNHLHLSHPLVAPLVRLLLQLHWRWVEHYLCDVRNAYRLIVERRPEARRVLDTAEGRRYLNWAARRLYDFLYEFTWGGGSA